RSAIFETLFYRPSLNTGEVEIMESPIETTRFRDSQEGSAAAEPTWRDETREALELTVDLLNKNINRYYASLSATAEDGAVDWMGIAAHFIERLLKDRGLSAESVTAAYNPERKTIVLNIATASGETSTVLLEDPDQLSETLKAALCARAEDIGE